MELVALRTRTANAPQQYHLGKMNAQRIEQGKIQNQAAQQDVVRGAMDMFGSVALGAMGGKLDGQVDPEKYEQGIDWLASQGMDVSALKGKPELAPVLARGSLGVLQAINMNKSDDEMQLRLRQFDMQMMQAAAQLENMRQKNDRDNARFDWEKEDRNKPDIPQPEPGFRWTDDTYTEQVPIAGGSADPDYIRKVNEAKAAGKPQGVSKGQEQIDKTFAKDEYVPWVQGGSADFVKQISQLEEAQRVLLSGDDNISGPVVSLKPDRMNPKGVSVREAVEEVVQRNLRLILGAQFTQAEGDKLIARAYNPKLQESENAKRLGRLIMQMKTAAAAKQSAAEHFEKNGTLQGWSGKMPTMQDFEMSMEDGPGQTVEDVTDKDQSRVISSGSESKVVSYKDYFE